MNIRTLLIQLLLFLLCGFPALKAQKKPGYESGVFTVASTGYYRIELSPEIINKLNKGFGNISLLDESGNEVYYGLKSEDHSSLVTNYCPLPIVDSLHRQGCCSEIVMHNTERHDIDNLVIKLNVAGLEKKITLMGSDDRQQWFMLSENYSFRSFDNNAGAAEAAVFNFPVTNYKYYKLKTDDFTSPPVYIAGVGHHAPLLIRSRYHFLSFERFRQTDDTVRKLSYVDISFAEGSYIDWLSFQTDVPAGGAYNAELYALDDSVSRTSFRAASFQFTSRYAACLLLNKLKGSHFRLVVRNGDYSPLKFRGLTAGQLKLYLVAYLQSSRKYHLAFGGNIGNTAGYEISHLGSTLTDSLPVVYPARIRSVAQTATETLAEETPSVYLYWLIGIFLFIVTGILVRNWLKAFFDRARFGLRPPRF